MQKLILTIKWFLKCWPVLIPALFAGLHISIAVFCAIDVSQINKIISLSLQIGGGILILYSIDSNIGIVNNESLFTLFRSWLKSFPMIKKSYTLRADSGTMTLTGHLAKLRVGGPGNTTEGHIKYLQQQIEWLKEDLNGEVKQLKSLVSEVDYHTKKEISEIRTSIGSVDRKFSEISVGGIGWQIFGILLMIHGAVASYLT